MDTFTFWTTLNSKAAAPLSSGETVNEPRGCFCPPPSSFGMLDKPRRQHSSACYVTCVPLCLDLGRLNGLHVTAAYFHGAVLIYEQIAPLSEVTLSKWQRVRGDFQVFQPESNPLVLSLRLIWAKTLCVRVIQ